MKETSADRALAKGVKLAQRETMTIGEVCCHPSLPAVQKLDRVEDDVAVLRSVEGEESRFPLAECFDPNVASDYAVQAAAIERTFSLN